MTLSPIRRFGLITIAIVVAALILHSQISESLVVRGDELAFSNSTAEALQKYRSAVRWDGGNASAVDRLCFHELLSHRPELLAEAIGVADRFLNEHPNDATILADRALALNLSHRYAEAARDFQMAALQKKDAELMTFAGFAALHAGDVKAAKRFFIDASRLDSHFTPARKALARLS